MRVISVRNVNVALASGLAQIQRHGVRQDSRNGPVVVFDTPVTTVYEMPQERVLFSEARDANPFFHLFESLWMLDGRDDPEYLNQFVSDFGSRYAEPDTGKLWGAYGHRWRNGFNNDQLDTVVERLTHDWTDRRSVIQMWDADLDLINPWDNPQPRDVPCNTQIYPRVRQQGSKKVLDITVTCRSNDLIWGAYGANAVHFSVLQEYLAARIGVGIGKYYQMSNNLHAYTDVLNRLVERSDIHGWNGTDLYSSRGAPAVVSPMFEGYTDSIDRDIALFMERPDSKGLVNPWYKNVAQPMMLAHQQYKNGQGELALMTLSQQPQVDWILAGSQWLARRLRSRK